jgi:hypothetical protein
MLDWVKGTQNSRMFTTHDVAIFLDGLEQIDNMIDKWHMYILLASIWPLLDEKYNFSTKLCDYKLVIPHIYNSKNISCINEVPFNI